MLSIWCPSSVVRGTSEISPEPTGFNLTRLVESLVGIKDSNTTKCSQIWTQNNPYIFNFNYQF